MCMCTHAIVCVRLLGSHQRMSTKVVIEMTSPLTAFKLIGIVISVSRRYRQTGTLNKILHIKTCFRLCFFPMSLSNFSTQLSFSCMIFHLSNSHCFVPLPSLLSYDKS